MLAFLAASWEVPSLGTWGLLLRSLELVSEGDKEPLENVTGSECLSS